MKRAINAWAFPGEMTFEDCFKKAKEIGFEAIELNMDSPIPEAGNHCFSCKSTEDDFKKVRELIDKYGIEVQSLACSTYWNKAMFGSNDPEKKNFAINMLRDHIRCAKGVGADAILVVPCLDRDIGLLENYNNTIKTFKELEEEINESGVRIGLENVWNRFWSSPMDAKYVIDGIGNKNVGIYLDLGNMIIMNDAEWWVEILADSIIKVHAKDFKRENGRYYTGDDCDLLEGDVNWDKVCSMLKNCYDGAITAELFCKQGEDFDAFCKKVNSALETIIAKTK